MEDPFNINNPTKECSVCKNLIVRIFQRFHRAPASGDNTKKRRKYSDETGRLWHGTKCPDCVAKWRVAKAQASALELQDNLKKQIEE